MNGKIVYPVVGVSTAIAAFLIVLSLNTPKPTTPAAFIHPPQTAVVVFPKGSGLQSHAIHVLPQTVTVVIGVNNTVEWINQDDVPTTVTSDSNYVDPVGGNFSAVVGVNGNYLLPGQTFNFTFTQPGQYNYHTIPHPFVQGSVIVLPP